MLKFKTFFAFAVLTLVFFTTSAAELKQGRDYELINPQQATEKGKIEVIEFFSYLCEHCDHMDPFVNKWQQTLAKDVVFFRVPVAFQRTQWIAPVKLYFTLDAMGELDKLHVAVFEAVHREHTNLTNEAGVTDWAVKKGLDRKKFSDIFKSFAVESKARGSKLKEGAYGISGVPTFVVAGKYRTPGTYPGGPDAILKLVDDLVAKARQEQSRK